MDIANRPEYFLQPGYIYFTRTPAVVRTVVGTCVAVCLWDQTNQFGGMNHFLHPRTREPEQATPKYGNVATAALIRIMEDAGCRREDLVAQIAGGARPQGSDSTVGDANVTVAREVLARKGVRVASEDVGGTMGRKILFDTATGQMVILKVHSIRESDWVVD
ncbi:MAG: hypothetical protein GWP08_12215 [Nitrospiraceae bacterium]|nr:hypothetical protein [Nitrospiraceae bacterium]